MSTSALASSPAMRPSWGDGCRSSNRPSGSYGTRTRLAEGRHPYYVFPTAKKMRWARTQFQGDAEGQPYAQLVTTMVPNIHADMYTSDEQPVHGFLRHQELTNDLAHGHPLLEEGIRSLLVRTDISRRHHA